MILEPKARFLRSEDAKKYSDMAASPAFHHALETSLMEMQLRPHIPNDPSASWHELKGAHLLADILLNLAEPPLPVRRGAPRENLQPT